MAQAKKKKKELRPTVAHRRGGLFLVSCAAVRRRVPWFLFGSGYRKAHFLDFFFTGFGVSLVVKDLAERWPR